jgi:N-alpha-acetyl-L-2,4-diaminobutyrate deacetylase
VTSYGALECTVDLGAEGKQIGHLELPRSTNTSGWSRLFVPIGVVSRGEGPTALVLAGNHGDEYEGQIAALELLRRLEAGDVHGRIVVLPCLSPEASRQGTRLWPTGANFNRSFPGRSDGAVNEQLAHFLSQVLMPMADVVVDVHTGGRSARFVTCSHMHWVGDADQRRKMIAGMRAWNTDYHLVYIDVAGSGLLPTEAEQQGKVVITTELGGGGYCSAATFRLAERGLANVLRHVGALEGEVETRSAMGLPEAVVLDGRDPRGYLFAPESGLFETLVDPGDAVVQGQPLGRIHFVERPDREPVVVSSPSHGVVACVRAIVPTEQGDNVVVVGSVMAPSELDRAG